MNAKQIEIYRKAQCLARRGAEYEQLVEVNQWPMDTCERCEYSYCCQNDWHVAGDMCFHCGLDERVAARPRYRGK